MERFIVNIVGAVAVFQRVVISVSLCLADGDKRMTVSVHPYIIDRLAECVFGRRVYLTHGIFAPLNILENNLAAVVGGLCENYSVNPFREIIRCTLKLEFSPRYYLFGAEQVTLVKFYIGVYSRIIGYVVVFSIINKHTVDPCTAALVYFHRNTVIYRQIIGRACTLRKSIASLFNIFEFQSALAVGRKDIVISVFGAVVRGTGEPEGDPLYIHCGIA